ncbi:hypothetical protein CGC48_03850 [Capnocytophaga cynodegmi]|uniref:Uncharacterized protein n=1 Tax=Capnocytophaga cynodegmi TaxID=28189 RepID=A0A250E7X5_9FLAO|nr:hypothetical protein CGC48_03850 [Capnocytophaga cynodegmi]
MLQKIRNFIQKNVHLPNNAFSKSVKELLLHIKKVKFLFWGMFILFSLTPCTVKGILFDSAEISFFKPLHKNRTTTSSFQCQNLVFANKKLRTECVLNVFDNHENDLLCSTEIFAFDTKIKKEYFNQNSANAPPKYILFRCLRIHLS